MLEEREYQNRIHDKSMAYLNGDGHKTLLIEAPTGSGKSVMGLKLCMELRNRGLKIGWVAHRKELLKQIEAANKNFFDIDDFQTISLFDRNPEQYVDRDVIVLDESHHDASASASFLHEAIRPSIIIGLTATPYRTDRMQLCFQKVVKDAGIHQLIREGWLAPFNQYIIEEDWTPQNVCNTYIADIDKWGKSVSYFLTCNEAIECAERLRSNGIKAEHVIGSSPREDILKAFDDGEIEHISNVAVLSEGFDCPTIKTVFVRPSGKGPTVQMAGRAFRKHPLTPRVNVVQSKHTRYPFTKHATAEEQWLKRENEWLSIDIKNLEGIFKEQRIKIINSNIDIPEYLIKKSTNQNFRWSE